jgi:thiol-disulfide isomerase/thioredoxin
MASVLSLALTRHVDGGAVLITAAYSVGTAVPMFAAMIGGRALLHRVPALSRNSGGIQRGFGVLMVVMGLAIGLGWDRKLQTAILTAFPSYGTGLTAVENTGAVKKALASRSAARAPAGTMMAAASSVSSAGKVFAGVTDEAAQDGALGDYGRAPEFAAPLKWLNTGGGAGAAGGPALDMAALRGKVVLIDFWTYSCVNCVRTIPYLRAWYQAYRDKGLVIVGVHTPEFEFEKSTANVEKATKDLGVTWPVVQDNDYAQWNAYGNRYWPAHYLIDAQGRVRAFHFGEGDYAGTEKVIQTLLREAGSAVGGIVSKQDPELSAQTPETYLGSMRARGIVSEERLVPGFVVDFHAVRTPANGEWSLKGRWMVTEEYVIPESAGELTLGFQARDVYLVIEPEAGVATIRVGVDGGPPRDTEDARAGVVTATESRLYHLVGLDKAGSHLLRLEVQGRARLYAFTFG